MTETTSRRGPKPGPRIRTVKPEMWQAEAMERVSIGGRLLYVGLITQADDEGRQSAHPALLRSRIFPFDDLAPGQLEEWLGELEAAGLAVRYAFDGRAYLHLPTWLEDQRIDKPSDSLLPPPPDGSGNSREDSQKATAGPDRTGTGPEGTGAARERALPAALRPSADHLRAALNDVAHAKGNDLIEQERVDRLVVAAADWIDHVSCSEAWRDYFLDGLGKPKTVKDVVASYRNWIGREKPPATETAAVVDDQYDKKLQVAA